MCTGSESIWLIRRSAGDSKELTIEVTDTRLGGPNRGWHLVLKKQ
jgi:hypothetical protein